MSPSLGTHPSSAHYPVGTPRRLFSVFTQTWADWKEAKALRQHQAKHPEAALENQFLALILCNAQSKLMDMAPTFQHLDFIGFCRDLRGMPSTPLQTAVLFSTMETVETLLDLGVNPTQWVRPLNSAQTYNDTYHVSENHESHTLLGWKSFPKAPLLSLFIHYPDKEDPISGPLLWVGNEYFEAPHSSMNIFVFPDKMQKLQRLIPLMTEQDINYQDKLGNTFFHYLVLSTWPMEEKMKTMDLLLQHGARVDIPNRQQKTVEGLIEAEHDDKPELGALLLQWKLHLSLDQPISAPKPMQKRL